MPHSVTKQEKKKRGKKMVGNTLNVYQQTNEQTKRDPSPQWNTIQPLKSSEALTGYMAGPQKTRCFGKEARYKKATQCVFHLQEIPKIGQSTETPSRRVVVPRWQDGEWVLRGTGLPFGGDENGLKLD